LWEHQRLAPRPTCCWTAPKSSLVASLAQKEKRSRTSKKSPDVRSRSTRMSLMDFQEESRSRAHLKSWLPQSRWWNRSCKMGRSRHKPCCLPCLPQAWCLLSFPGLDCRQCPGCQHLQRQPHRLILTFKSSVTASASSLGWRPCSTRSCTNGATAGKATC